MPVLGQILKDVLQKNYLEKEMVGAGEFIDQLLDRLFYFQMRSLKIPLKLCLQILISVLHADTLKE